MNNVEQCCTELIPLLIKSGFRGEVYLIIKKLDFQSLSIPNRYYLELSFSTFGKKVLSFGTIEDSMYFDEPVNSFLMNQNMKQEQLNKLYNEVKEILSKLSYPTKSVQLYTNYYGYLNLDTLECKVRDNEQY